MFTIASKPFPEAAYTMGAVELFNLIQEHSPLHEDEVMRRMLDGDFNLSEWDNREWFRAYFSYAVPTMTAVQRIMDFANGPIIEINAGRALWGHLIMLLGGSVLSTDIHVDSSGVLEAMRYVPLKHHTRTWKTVVCMDAVAAVTGASEKTLMTIWPSYESSYAAKALQTFQGNKLAYIGEFGGCTADSLFHEVVDAAWKPAGTVKIPVWFGLHDCVMLYERK